ncbi:uncharacterized protein DNG_01367 [Cephalotrichum gorgonifer]|uniref:PLD phosphodiesterase domain-containing protein n=1 Tax=Cephalotrichum gorgonifer TaxID=2041049 RepID=A0AAE8MRH9_9PEZI|nr:uncharacterized protein DNG_01367 [Cephalotrichum gorgonifer]
MVSSKPEIIDLASSSDDEDEDLKRAIAMSLQDVAASTAPPANAPEQPTKFPETHSKPKEAPVVTPGLATFGSVVLDRKKMEEERQARIAKRKLPLDGSPDQVPAPQRPRLSRETATRRQVKQDVGAMASATDTPSSTASSSRSLPFPKGAVKRTWASRCEREGDDIKIEEVFQKQLLKLAVLASYQWDDDWLLSKIDITRTRLICVAYARDEAHKDQMRANVPSSHVKFCFPPMNGPGAMHAKIQLLKFPDYLRIVVPSGNLTSYDWGETGVLENCSSLGNLNRQYLSSFYAALKGKSGYQNTDALVVRSSKSRPTRDEDLLTDHFRVYFPSQKTISASRGGPGSAGTIAFQSKWWEAASFPRNLFRDCVCRRRGLLLHSKAIFVRHTPSDGATLGWAYVGSANLSESAWGRLVKDKSTNLPRMSCRNWECGVVLSVPQPQSLSDAGETLGIETLFRGHVPIPMGIPGAAYSQNPEAQPWFFQHGMHF